MSEQAPELTAPGNTSGTPEEQPPWAAEGDFNPEKAWNLIQNLRADKERLNSRRVITDEEEQQLAEYQRIAEANRTDAERQAEELARWQSEAQKWREQAVSSRIAAMAADFADPSDAIAALGDKNYLNAGGDVDEAAIAADLAELLEKKPHWRRTSDGPVAPRAAVPNPAQGAGGGQVAASSAPADQFAAILQAQLRAPR